RRRQEMSSSLGPLNYTATPPCAEPLLSLTDIQIRSSIALSVPPGPPPVAPPPPGAAGRLVCAGPYPLRACPPSPATRGRCPDRQRTRPADAPARRSDRVCGDRGRPANRATLDRPRALRIPAARPGPHVARRPRPGRHRHRHQGSLGAQQYEYLGRTRAGRRPGGGVPARPPDDRPCEAVDR